MHVVGDTHVFIKCSNFNNVILSGPAVVLRGLSQQVIVGMNFLRDNHLNLNLNPDHAQISEPSIPQNRSRSEQKLQRGGMEKMRPFKGLRPKCLKKV